jgi:hypothetical protein
VRLLKVAFKAAKFCLDGDELELGVKVLERAAAYVEDLGSADTQLVLEDESVRQRLVAEYYVMRTALVCLSTAYMPDYHC